MTIRAVITGVGGYLPARIMSNAELETKVETSDAWIRERTGITQRHIAAEGETTADLAAHAATKALADAGITANDIDLLIVATTTPDLTMPSTATLVQQRIGMHQGCAFDIAAVCSGFVYGLGVVKAMIENGQAKRALLIGAETMSRVIDWNDRNTCVLFGDGAGAVVIEAQTGTDRGIIAVNLKSDGRLSDILATYGGVSKTQTTSHLFMMGQDVFRHGVEKMTEIAEETLSQNSMTTASLDWLVPHQANARMLHAIAKRLKVEPEKLVVTVDRHANTSAASIPLALDHAKRAGTLRANHTLGLVALGAGLTWGCCIIKW